MKISAVEGRCASCSARHSRRARAFSDANGAASNHESGAVQKLTLAEMIAEAAELLPRLDDSAFGRLFDRFADQRVVMLGEASHGTSEFYQARCDHPSSGCASRLHHSLRWRPTGPTPPQSIVTFVIILNAPTRSRHFSLWPGGAHARVRGMRGGCDRAVPGASRQAP